MARKDKEISPTAASYLGSLRSELDDSNDLDYNFIKLESAFGLVRSAFVSKMISSANAAKLFQKLYITSADNADWTLGSTTASWYRREHGGAWVHSTPPIGITVDEKKLPSWITKGIEDDINACKVEESPKSSPLDIDEITDIEIVSNKELSKNIHLKIDSIGKIEENNDIDWLNEEWKLAGNDIIAPAHPVKPELNSTKESVEDNISSPAPRDGHFSPEDFFLKDE